MTLIFKFCPGCGFPTDELSWFLGVLPVLVAAAKHAPIALFPARPGACLRAQSTGSVGVWVPWQACEAVRCCPEDVTSLISVLNLHKCKLVSAGLTPRYEKIRSSL